MSKENRLIAYTDGSCSPNPGRGGWGFIVIDGNFEFHINGGCEKSTNNIMELTAVTEMLKMFKHIQKFHIYSDSRYVINIAKGKWKCKTNFVHWKRYNKYAKNKDIMWTWVKGHNGNKYNEKVDKLAKEFVFQ